MLKIIFILFLKHCFALDNGRARCKVSLCTSPFHWRAGNKVLCFPLFLLYFPLILLCFPLIKKKLNKISNQHHVFPRKKYEILLYTEELIITGTRMSRTEIPGCNNYLSHSVTYKYLKKSQMRSLCFRKRIK